MKMELINIAVLYTCHNRKEKTCTSICSLKNAIEYYNKCSDLKIFYKVFITDDGCNDGTMEAVVEILKKQQINIISADGNAFWAGGMRLAWKEALRDNNKYDFYLLLNDDTYLKENCLKELLYTNQYAISFYGSEGVYTGFTCDPTDETIITYGAKTYKKGILKGAVNMHPTGLPQECNMPNANILLVGKRVCMKIGILSDSYIHGAADWDYGIRALRAGFPVLTTSFICGYCEKDHDMAEIEAKKIIPMTIQERKTFLNRPTKQYKDSFTFFKKYNIVKYYLLHIGYYLNVYYPSLFYKLSKLRGH